MTSIGKAQPGKLLGREKIPLGRRGAPTVEERNKAEDYRDFVGLYALYGDGKLICIGEAGLGTDRKPFDRLKEHRKGPLADRWDAFSWFGRKTCDGQIDILPALRQLEAISIAIINPGFNKQSGTFSDATQVFQVPHEQSEGDLETKIERLSILIKNLNKSA